MQPPTGLLPVFLSVAAPDSLETGSTMDRIETLASEFANRTPESLSLLEEFSRQYRSSVHVPFHDDPLHLETARGLGEKFSKRAFTPAIVDEHHFIIATAGPAWLRKAFLSVQFNDGVVPISEIIAALQCCIDKQQPVPFDLGCIDAAIQALQSRDAERILQQSEAIQKQVLRYKRAGTAPQPFGNSSSNDTRDKWLRCMKAKGDRTLKEILVELKKAHPEWSSLENETSVNSAIRRYEKRKGLKPLPTRKRLKN